MDFSELSGRAPWMQDALPCGDLHAQVIEAFAVGGAVLRVAPGAQAFDPGCGWPFHTWPELFLQLAGRRTFRCPGGTIASEPGQAVLIPRGIPHQERAQDLGQGECCLVVMPRARRLILHLSHLAGSLRLPTHHYADYGDPDGASTDLLCDEVAAAVAGGDGRAVAPAFTALLWHQWRCVRSGEDPPGAGSALVERCRRLASMRLTEPGLGVERLARDLGVGADHLGRCFRRETGETLIGHIVRRRIDMAAGLLAERHLPVRAAAWACGFRDPLYFSRVFRRLKGVPPRAWPAPRPSAGG